MNAAEFNEFASKMQGALQKHINEQYGNNTDTHYRNVDLVQYDGWKWRLHKEYNGKMTEIDVPVNPDSTVEDLFQIMNEFFLQ